MESTEYITSNNVCNFFLLVVGKVLAIYEVDARSFFSPPEPKLVPSFSGGEHEVLMTRDPTFPVSYVLTGIALS